MLLLRRASINALRSKDKPFFLQMQIVYLLMKKNLIVGIIFVSLLLYSNGLFDNFDKKRKMLQDNLSKKYGNDKANKLLRIYDALKLLKLPQDTIRLALSQVMHETGVFAGSQRASGVNNFSGITFSGSAEQLKSGAYKSNISLPNAELPKDAKGKVIESKRIFYAGFPTVTNWANEYIRILSKGSKPIQAINTVDFANRLKKNGYYTDLVSNYVNGLNFFYNFLTKTGI